MKTFGNRILLVLAVATLLNRPSACGAEPQVITYPFPEDLPASGRFDVSVDGQPVFTHATEVADFAMFAIRGPVQVTVVCDQPVTSAIVRPRSRNIVPQWEAKTVRFTVEQPGPLSVEINGIRNVRLTDIQLLEKVPPQSFLINSGGELSGVTFQNVRQGDRVLDSAEDLGLSVEAARGVRFTR